MNDTWGLLAQWAEKKTPALTVTLLKPAGEAEAGLMAVAEKSIGALKGPLTEAAFWNEDWPALLEATGSLPETGRKVEAAGRMYYLAPLSFNRSALVLGGGHVGEALSRLLRFLDFEVSLMDDRAEFLTDRGAGVSMVEAPFEELSGRFADSGFDAVIIVTRGHAQDTGCLRQVLKWRRIPGYLGMIGSRHRTSATLKMLAEEGFDPKLLSEVHTPVGLKIGAQTPAEIAVSIAAEIILVLNQAG